MQFLLISFFHLQTSINVFLNLIVSRVCWELVISNQRINEHDHHISLYYERFSKQVNYLPFYQLKNLKIYILLLDKTAISVGGYTFSKAIFIWYRSLKETPLFCLIILSIIWELNLTFKFLKVGSNFEKFYNLVATISL